MSQANALSEITFASDAPLGIGLKAPNGQLIVSSVDASSPAAAIPVGSKVVAVNGADTNGKPREEVMAIIADAKKLPSLTITFEKANETAEMPNITVELTDVASPKPLGKETSWQHEPLKDTPFLRYKAFFYTTRLIRELVPALSISLCLYDIFTSMFFVVFGANYDNAAFFLPGKSFRLDKMMMMTHILHSSNPVGRIIALDAYDASWQLKGTWKGPASDDWWCIAVGESERHHVPYVGDGVCGAPTNSSFDCSSLGNSLDNPGARYLLGDGWAGFPDADAGFRCAVAPSLPAAAPKATAHGDCYSMCIDVAATAPTNKVMMVMDVWWFIISPICIDLYFLLLWTHAYMLLRGVKQGGMPRWLQIRYGFAALFNWFVFLLVLASSSSLYGWWAPDWWPGGSPATLVIFFLLASMFTGLALEQNFKPIRCIMVLIYKFMMWLVDLKTPEEAEGKWPVDSDSAYCFYLVRIYKAKASYLKKGILAFIIYGVIIGTSLWLLPLFVASLDFNGFDFLMSKFITLVLLAVSIFSALKPPQFLVDYRAYQKKKEHYPDLTLVSELKNLMSSAFGLVSKEALRYLNLEMLDEKSAVQVTDDKSGTVKVNPAMLAGAAAAVSIAGMAGAV